MQTSYSVLAPEGLLGLMTEDFHTRFVDTVVPTTAVKIGKLLTADLTAGKPRNAAKLPSVTIEANYPQAMGVTVWDQSREGGSDWPANRPTPVMRRGRIWVRAESAVTRWSTPYVRTEAGAGGTELGSFRADADTATATAFMSGVFLTDAAAGELVLLEISLF